MLRAAGHHPSHGLMVAFDTLTTSVDLLSIPVGPTVWWIIRDGIARELLRPVALWYEDHSRYVVTLNSHGQANAVTCSPEVAALRRLPQGARGYTSMPFSRIFGHLTHHGLVLTEAAIGSLTVATSWGGRRSLPWSASTLAALLWATGVSAMQQQPPPWAPVPAQQRNSPHAWVSVPLQPRCMRVWTHTIEAPVVFDYQPRPDPEFLTRHLAHIGRGVPPVGDFVWTTPTVVQGVAHLVHIPPNCIPPMLFWLLHYRGRAAVVAVPQGHFDWARVAQLALDHFGADLFRRNAFSIQHQAYVFPYGANVPVPPHGSILHLVRSAHAPSAGFTSWETVPDPVGMLHFDYDICEGPGDEVCLEPDLRADHSGHTLRPASTAAPARVDTVPTTLLSRQVNDVVAQLETLTLRLRPPVSSLPRKLPRGLLGRRNKMPVVVGPRTHGPLSPNPVLAHLGRRVRPMWHGGRSLGWLAVDRGWGFSSAVSSSPRVTGTSVVLKTRLSRPARRDLLMFSRLPQSLFHRMGGMV